jgi:transcriptional regulator with XRE-family HTH domain
MDSKALKAWRERNGLNQDQLAEMLGVHKITLCRWETNFSPIPNFLDLALAELDRRLAIESEGGKIKSRKEVKTNGSKDKRKKAR